jgi:SAM-dependent methyltransferase
MNQMHLEFLASPAWAERLRVELLPWLDEVGGLGDDVLEVGPGPGLTTDLLRTRVARLTALEIDPDLARPLATRLEGTNVSVLEADVTASGLEDASFSAVTCFSMLHHMPTPADQDRMFAEVSRLLRSGGVFVGVDSMDVDAIRDAHVDDTFTPVDPETLPDRLERAGLADVSVEPGELQLRFVAHKPA